MKKYSIGRQAVGCALALGMGLIQLTYAQGDFGLTMAAYLTALASPVLIAVLYAWAGPVPALVAAASTTACLYAGLGSIAVLLGYPLIALAPAGVAIYLFERRKPFFPRMRAAVIAQFAVLLLALGAIYLAVGQNLVDAMIGQMREAFGSLPASIVDWFLSIASLSGLLDSSAGVADAINAGTITAAQRVDWLEQVLAGMSWRLKLSLPGFMVTFSVVSGMLMTSLPSAISVRRGDEPAMPHVPLHDWYVPNQVMLGVAGSFALGYIMMVMGVGGSDSLTTAISSILTLLLAVQALAGVARLMRTRGVSRGKRTLILLAMFVLLSYVLQMIGMFISLFGARGIVTEFIRKRRDKSNKEGDGQ